jgi:hypothetical protein
MRERVSATTPTVGCRLTKRLRPLVADSRAAGGSDSDVAVRLDDAALSLVAAGSGAITVVMAVGSLVMVVERSEFFCGLQPHPDVDRLRARTRNARPPSEAPKQPANHRRAQTKPLESPLKPAGTHAAAHWGGPQGPQATGNPPRSAVPGTQKAGLLGVCGVSIGLRGSEGRGKLDRSHSACSPPVLATLIRGPGSAIRRCEVNRPVLEGEVG